MVKLSACSIQSGLHWTLSYRHDWPTLDHVFASLAAGGPTEDVLLETVSLDRLHRLGLRLWLGFGGHRQRGTDGGRLRWQRQVGTAGRGVRVGALVGRGAFGEGGRRWRRRRCGDDCRGKAGFAVAALEKVVHALAAHDWFEGQGALQPLQLEDENTREAVRGTFLLRYKKLQRHSYQGTLHYQQEVLNSLQTLLQIHTNT